MIHGSGYELEAHGKAASPVMDQEKWCQLCIAVAERNLVLFQEEGTEKKGEDAEKKKRVKLDGSFSWVLSILDAISHAGSHLTNSWCSLPASLRHRLIDRCHELGITVPINLPRDPIVNVILDAKKKCRCVQRHFEMTGGDIHCALHGVQASQQNSLQLRARIAPGAMDVLHPTDATDSAPPMCQRPGALGPRPPPLAVVGRSTLRHSRRWGASAPYWLDERS